MFRSRVSIVATGMFLVAQAGAMAGVSGAQARAVSPQVASGVATRPAPSVELPRDYVIGAEDVLSVVFWRDTEMSGDVTVRPDGLITLPLLGEVQAAGLTPDALRDGVQKAAAKYIEDPNVSVVVKAINSRKVFITGQVATPGAYPLIAPRTVMQLIALAGGLTEYADSKSIRIVRTEQGKTVSFKFNYKDVAKGNKLDQNIQLKPGDTVIVP